MTHVKNIPLSYQRRQSEAEEDFSGRGLLVILRNSDNFPQLQLIQAAISSLCVIFCGEKFPPCGEAREGTLSVPIIFNTSIIISK